MMKLVLPVDDDKRDVELWHFYVSDEPQDIAGAYRLGADSYVINPTLAEDFTVAICRTVAFWLRHNSLPPIDPPGLLGRTSGETA